MCLCSGFEQQSLSNGNSSVVGGGSKDAEYQERMRKLREVQKKSKEAKKQITDKVLCINIIIVIQ